MQDFDIFKMLPSNSIAAAEILCSDFLNNYSAIDICSTTKVDYYYQFMLYCKTNNVELEFPTLSGKDQHSAATAVQNFFDLNIITLKEMLINNLAKDSLSGITLTAADKMKLQELIDQIRKLTNESNTIQTEQKERILSALNALQVELDKPLGDFFAWLGKLMLLTEATKGLADTAKPILSGIEKIYKIIKQLMPDNISLPPSANFSELPPGSGE